MKEYITNNLGLKLIALLLAVSIEVYFKSPQNLVTEVIKVPVEVRTPSQRKVLTSIDTDAVAVKVRGPSPLVQQIQGAVRQFHIDVPPNPPDLLPYQLRVEDLGLPRGIEVVEISPARLDLRFEQLMSRSLTVKPVIQGKVSPGYVLADVRVSPATVVARGPASALKKWSEIETQPIDLTKLSEPKEFQAYLIDPTEGDRELESKLALEVSVVDITVDVRPKKGTRTFSRLPVAVKNNGAEATGVVLQPEHVSVVVASSENRLAELKEGEIAVFVDVTKAQPNSSRVPVTVELPEGMTLEKTTPETVRVVQQ